MNFNVYPRLFYFTLFPLIVGILLRFLQSINRETSKQNWSFQPDKFIAITVPTLFISFSPALLFSPLAEYLPYLVNIILINTTFVTIISLIAGYSLLDCFIQKDNANMKSIIEHSFCFNKKLKAKAMSFSNYYTFSFTYSINCSALINLSLYASGTSSIVIPTRFRFY